VVSCIFQGRTGYTLFVRWGVMYDIGFEVVGTWIFVFLHTGISVLGLSCSG